MAGISYFWFLGALFQMAVILVGTESLHLSDTRTGLLVTALAVGIGIGSIAAGWLSGDTVEIGLVPCGAALLGLCFRRCWASRIPSRPASCGWRPRASRADSSSFRSTPSCKSAPSPRKRGGLLATNNFLNMIGVVLASGALYLFHDLLRWTPSHILAALGVLTLVATVYIAWLVPAPLVRLILWSLANLLFKIRIVGADNIPKKGGALIVSNHVSYADAILIGCATPRFIRFLMWQPLYESKWLNPFCRLLYAIPIPTHSKESLRALRNARAELEKGSLVCIFPEGEITRTSHVKPFERGVDVITRGLDVHARDPGLPGRPVGPRAQPQGRPSVRFAVEAAARSDGLRRRADNRRCQLRASAPARPGTRHASRRMPQERGQHSVASIHRRRQDATGRPVALADSTGKQLTFGQTLTAALLLKKWIRAHCVGIALHRAAASVFGRRRAGEPGRHAGRQNRRQSELHRRRRRHGARDSKPAGSRPSCPRARFSKRPSLPNCPAPFSWKTCWRRSRPASKALAMAAGAIAARAHSWPARRKPDDLAAVIFSSGSTGTPKGVMLSHWNLIANVDATAQVYSVDHTDCMLGVLPFFHSFGFTYTLWFPLLNGFKAVFHPNPTDAKAIGELAGAHHPTLFLSTPTFCLGYLRKCTREQLGSIPLSAGGRGKAAARAGEIVRREIRRHAAGRLRLHRNGAGGIGQRRSIRNARRTSRAQPAGRCLMFRCASSIRKQWLRSPPAKPDCCW